MDIPSKETNRYTTNMCPKIHFNVYISISRCTLHGRRTYKENTTCSIFSTMSIADNTKNLYTHMGIVLLETSITSNR